MRLPCNLTIEVLRVIGSPFVSEHAIPDPGQLTLLYNHAVKNKIGLLFLCVLKDMDMLGELETAYYDSLRDYRELRVSLERASQVLEDNEISHAIFKTLMPFPAVLSDVDILLLDRYPDLQRTLRIMSDGGYECVSDMSPLKVSLHDPREGPHVEGSNDPYDIDIYSEIRANFFVYIDKCKIIDYVVEMDSERIAVPTLADPADLIVSLSHSFFEHLYTSLHYYLILNYLSRGNIRELFLLAQENRALNALKTTLLITAHLHNMVHGFVPDSLDKFLSIPRLSPEPSTKRFDYEMPHKYGLDTIASVLLEKLSEGKAVRSLADQLLHMADPRLTAYILRHFFLRRKREAY